MAFFPIKDMQTPPSSPLEVFNILWKMRHVLYKMGKNNKKTFFYFYLSSYGWKLIENWGHFEYKNDHNSKKKNCKNRKFYFSFYSADSGSFMYIWKIKKKALSQLRICRPLPLRSGQKLMKDAECAEKNGEYNLKILRFLFYELSRKLIEN